MPLQPSHPAPKLDAPDLATPELAVHELVAHELKTQVAALERAEARYATLFQTTRDLIQSVRLDGSFEFVNPAWLRTLGYGESDLPGLHFQDVIHPDQQDHCRECLAEVLAGKPLEEVETIFVTRDGQPVVVEGSVTPYLEDGEIVALQGLFRDVTERRNVEIFLQESEAWLRALVEYSTDNIAILDPDGHVRFASPSVEDTLGYRPGEMMSYNLLELIHPDDRLRFGQALESCIGQPGGSARVEYRIQHTEARWVVLDSIITNLLDQPALQGMLVISRDITVRKEVEDALQESEKRLRSVLNSSPDVIYSLDLRSGQTSFLNRQEILGFSRDEFHTFGHILSAVHPDDRDAVERYWFELLQCSDAETKHLEVRLRHREGHAVWFQMRGTVSSREDSELIREVLITLTDITERRQIEQQLDDYRFRLEGLVNERTSQLNRARERVESILNSSSDAIVLASAEGTIQQTNPQFNLTFNCEIDAYFDQQLSVLVDADSAAALTEALRVTLAEREGQRLEVIATRHDGSRFYADVSVSAVAPSKRADPSGAVCQFRDITQRKQIEAELRKALARERELGELKSRFVSMASHEFRTPLATIMATADTLRNYIDRMQPEDVERRFDKIQAEVRHMTALIEEVLLVGSAEAGRVDFRPEVFDVVIFSKDILERLERTDRGAHTLSFQPEGPHTTVHADMRLLRQIITNLVSNALKYSPAGSTVELGLDCTAPDAFTLRVVDSGIGIPPADQQHLFEAFHRATNVGTIPGTGLGMSITHHAVDLHNGTITFESVVDAGTTFHVRVPYSLPEETEEPTHDESSGH